MLYTMAMRALIIPAIVLVAVVLGISALFSASTIGVALGNGEECAECEDERAEAELEIIDEEIECMEDAENQDEVDECIAEADDDRDEADEELRECREDNC